MADSTVTALTAASSLDGTELYYVVQGGADRKATGTQIKTLAGASIGSSISGGTAGSVLFLGAGPVLAQDNSLFSWNDGAQTLQIGTTSKASLVGSVAGAYDSTTHGSVRIGGSPGATSFFDLMSNPNGANSIPVPTFRPVVANKTIALDICPNGSPTDAGFGKAWIDLCNTDQITSGNAATQTIHMAAHAASFFLGAAEYITSTILPFNFGTFNGDTATETTTFTINADASLSIVQPIKLGGADAASPTAQTLSMQSVVAGTSNTAGVDWTINGSKGTGTGAGGSTLFFVAPASGTGTSQNTLRQAVKIGGDGVVAIANNLGNTNSILLGGGYFGAVVGNTALGYHANAVTTQVLEFNNSSIDGNDTYITRPAAAALQMGQADAAAPVAQTFGVQSVVAGTTDTAGADWTRLGSKGTGTGASGNLVEKTGFSAKSTGSSQHTTVDREIVVAKGKVLTSAAAFSMFDIALPTLSMCGGMIEATIICTDGTDMQSFTQTVTYSAVNKGGVYTTSITPSTGDKSVSAGTLTTSWTVVSGTNKVTIKVTPTTSLTPSANSFLLYYRVKNNSEQATTIL